MRLDIIPIFLISITLIAQVIVVAAQLFHNWYSSLPVTSCFILEVKLLYNWSCILISLSLSFFYLPQLPFILSSLSSLFLSNFFSIYLSKDFKNLGGGGWLRLKCISKFFFRGRGKYTPLPSHPPHPVTGRPCIYLSASKRPHIKHCMTYALACYFQMLRYYCFLSNIGQLISAPLVIYILFLILIFFSYLYFRKHNCKNAIVKNAILCVLDVLDMIILV